MIKKANRRRGLADKNGRQVVWHLDDFARHVRENWGRLGLTPVYLRALVEQMGWWADLIDDCFGELVGLDYADIKMTEWIERLKGRGYDFPSGKSVLAILDEILKATWGVGSGELMPHMMNGLSS
jgi:hypothetical protein